MDYPVHVHELNVKDPQILADPVSKKYYMYSNFFTCGLTPDERTGTGNTFYAICSEDLVHWSNPILVFEQNDFWAGEDYTGPEGYYIDGKYYIIAAFSAPGIVRSIQALVSDSPLGPFLPAGEPLTPPMWQCSDGTLYFDRDGEAWLVFAHDWVQVYDGQICAIPVAKDLSRAEGNPMILFRGSEAPWGDDFIYATFEGGGAASGPCVHRMADGGLIMLWTNSTPFGYAVGVAKSLTGEICGPWQQYDRPLYCHDGAHASLFRRLCDNGLMMPLWLPGREVFGVRGTGVQTLIFDVEEAPNGLIEIISEFTGSWWAGIGGHAISFRLDKKLKDEPTFSRVATAPGRRVGNIKWGLAPETKYKKGKITVKIR